MFTDEYGFAFAVEGAERSEIAGRLDGLLEAANILRLAGLHVAADCVITHIEARALDEVIVR